MPSSPARRGHYAKLVSTDNGTASERLLVARVTTTAGDREKVSDWIGRLFKEKGTDIYRGKGLPRRGARSTTSYSGSIHTAIDTGFEKPRGGAPRENTMVWIGKNLDRAARVDAF